MSLKAVKGSCLTEGYKKKPTNVLSTLVFFWYRVNFSHPALDEQIAAPPPPPPPLVSSTYKASLTRKASFL